MKAEVAAKTISYREMRSVALRTIRARYSRKHEQGSPFPRTAQRRSLERDGDARARQRGKSGLRVLLVAKTAPSTGGPNVLRIAVCAVNGDGVGVLRPSLVATRCTRAM